MPSEPSVLCVGSDLYLVQIRCHVLVLSGFRSRAVETEDAVAALRQDHYDILVIDGDTPREIAAEIFAAARDTVVVALPMQAAGIRLVELVKGAAAGSSG
jgi:hypothetical protein